MRSDEPRAGVASAKDLAALSPNATDVIPALALMMATCCGTASRIASRALAREGIIQRFGACSRNRRPKHAAMISTPPSIA